jgi:hypothetical protein
VPGRDHAHHVTDRTRSYFSTGPAGMRSPF